MTGEELRALQAPLKERYRQDPAAAMHRHTAQATLDPLEVACRLDTWAGPVEAGLHAAAGGDGSWACAGEMLLQALVACAGVTLRAVATAMDIPVRGGSVSAEGDLDFRGTLGMSRDVPVGFAAVRLTIALDSDATAEQLAKLVSLTERYCVVYQTLKSSTDLSTRLATDPEST
jgi:uncharacterized OsmC-like protein